jgi:hypothetical protein
VTQPAQRADGQTSAPELPRPRRIVTGHDERGRSIIVSDGPAPNVVSPPGLPSNRASVMWVADRVPASNAGNEDTAPAELRPAMGPPTGGVLLRIADFPPDSEYHGVDVGEMFHHINRGDDPREGVPQESFQKHFWFHKTPTLDYAICLEGEIWALLDEDETRMLPGDVLIQRGTSHAWANRTDKMARMAFVLIDAIDDGA